MRFAMLGLSLSHPFIFADYLESQGHRVAAVWDYDPAAAQAFAAQHRAVAAPAPAEAVAMGVDGVIVTSHTADHAAHARLARAAGLPVYVDKLLALNPAEAEALVQPGPVVMACSALRFLPDFQLLAASVVEPLTASAVVYHDMEAYLKPPHSWQDDPARSGGVLMNMGVHAADLLVAALRPDWTVTAAEKARRVYPRALSEDQAAILMRRKDGVLADIRVVSGVHRHFYGLTVTGATADYQWQFPDPAHQTANLYAPMLDAFVNAAKSGVWPVLPHEMVSVVRILAAARQLADFRPL